MSLSPKLSMLALSAFALSAAPVAASAQSTTPTFGGPVVPGVCMLAQEAVLANAKAGMAATARLRQLAQTAGQSIAPEGQAIQTEAKTLESQKAGLSATQFQTRQTALAKRYQAFQAQQQTIERQIEATRQKAVGQITQAEQPLAVQVYQQHNCGILLSRDAIIGGNMANDLTAGVVQALDAAMPTITFDLEPAPPPSAGSASQ